MSNITKYAILQAKVDGVLTDLMVKTEAGFVYVEENVTLAAKLAEIIASVNLRAKSVDVTAEINAAISTLLNGAPETYNTLKEIADYIAEHADVVETLTAAIGDKADKTVVNAMQETVSAMQATIAGLGALATKNQVGENDLDTATAGKLNAAYQEKHSHANRDVLDGITLDKVEGWDSKSRVYIDAVEPVALTANDVWLQIVEQ